MVISTLRFVPSAKHRAEALEILRSVLGPMGAEPGCLNCQIYEEDPPGQSALFCAHWETEAALHAHIRSELYLRILAACELSSQLPVFCFHHVSKTQGISLVHRLRGQGKTEAREARATGARPSETIGNP